MSKKKALITGGSRGIGRAIVEKFAKENFADVVFIYRSSEDAANALASELSNDDVKVFAVKADVSDFQQAQEAVNQSIELLGGLDILVNNAGITRDNLLLRMNENDFDDVIAANLKSVFNFTKAAIRTMLKQRYGSIINISSIVGLTGNAGQANYAASKSGIIGFTKSTAKEFASRNIRANVICPGFIETDMTEALNEEQRKALLENIPLNRIGSGEDIANAVKFLASDEASYITGQVLTVDGGMVM